MIDRAWRGRWSVRVFVGLNWISWTFMPWSNTWSQLHNYKCRGRMMTYPWTVDRSRAFMNTKSNSCSILASIFWYHIWREWSVILSQDGFQAAMILSQNGFHAAMQGWCPATMWIHKYTIFGGYLPGMDHKGSWPVGRPWVRHHAPSASLVVIKC